MSTNKQTPQTAAGTPATSGIPTEFLLSLAAAPVLLGIVSIQAVGSWLQAAGVASEEVFRGDRLPVLHFPDTGCQEEE